jgi:hypothetical protein
MLFVVAGIQILCSLGGEGIFIRFLTKTVYLDLIKKMMDKAKC